MSIFKSWLIACCAAVLGLGVVAPTAGAADSHVLVVAPFGSDANPGTAVAPLLTIQVAVRRLGAGGVVELRGGVYEQRVHLLGVHDVTIRPFAHEHPVLDGSSLTPHAGLTAMIEIADSAGVTVSGLEVTGFRTTRLNVTPAGIYVHGHGKGIRIVGNHVHDLGNDNQTLGSFDIDAHGIAVYGDDPHASISQLSIDGNEVDHLHLGASESVVVNADQVYPLVVHPTTQLDDSSRTKPPHRDLDRAERRRRRTRVRVRPERSHHEHVRLGCPSRRGKNTEPKNGGAEGGWPAKGGRHSKLRWLRDAARHSRHDRRVVARGSMAQPRWGGHRPALACRHCSRAAGAVSIPSADSTASAQLTSFSQSTRPPRGEAVSAATFLTPSVHLRRAHWHAWPMSWLCSPPEVGLPASWQLPSRTR